VSPAEQAQLVDAGAGFGLGNQFIESDHARDYRRGADGAIAKTCSPLGQNHMTGDGSIADFGLKNADLQSAIKPHRVK
jgi:hypothetical protein